VGESVEVLRRSTRQKAEVDERCGHGVPRRQEQLKDGETKVDEIA